MSEQAEDVGPTYRLELLIEDNDNNQKYMTDVPWIDTITPQTTDKLTLAYGITADWLTGSENVTVSSPSNWSIQAVSNKDSIAYMRGSKAQTSDVEIDDTKAQVSLRNFGTLTACSVKYTDDTPPKKVTDYSKVELTPLSYFLSEMDGQVYGVRVYTAYGYLLATIPVICRISHYASTYIDNMAQYNGTVKIDEDNAIIYSPRILAGKYEDVDAGQKIFTGVALGDYWETNTDPSMRLTGIYGFNKGTQVYAFKEDGTAFIGSGNGRINFDGTNATLYNSNYESNQGMLIDLDSSDIFCKNGNYQAYFGAGDSNYPLQIGNNFSVDWDGNVNIGGNGSINIDEFRADRDGVHIGNQTNYINIGSNGIQMNGSISFPSSSISSSAIKGLDDEINQATSNINSYTADKMLKDLYNASNKGENGLFTWSEDGMSMTGLNANCINAGVISADRIGVGNLKVTVGITQGFDLLGDASEGISQNPNRWIKFGRINTETGSAGNYKTYGVKIAVDQKDSNGNLTKQENLLFISDAGIRIELGGGSDNGGVTFGFYNDGLWISGSNQGTISSKLYSWG